ncbi:zincin-like metallopeptidase domain-containing protein [Myxococcota bacterium]
MRGYDDAPLIEEGGFAAAHSPITDAVEMPRRACFDSPESWYCTLFHELSHSSGHRDRLAREGVTNLVHFGSHEYSKEEMIAELGSAYLCGEAGISQSTLESSAAYISNWVTKLNNDKRLVVQAAAHAQKAADLILGHTAFQADEEGRDAE